MLFVPFKKLHNQIAIIVRNVLCKDFIQILKFYDVQGGKKKKKKLCFITVVIPLLLIFHIL